MPRVEKLNPATQSRSSNRRNKGCSAPGKLTFRVLALAAAAGSLTRVSFTNNELAVFEANEFGRSNLGVNVQVDGVKAGDKLSCYREVLVEGNGVRIPGYADLVVTQVAKDIVEVSWGAGQYPPPLDRRLVHASLENFTFNFFGGSVRFIEKNSDAVICGDWKTSESTSFFYPLEDSIICALKANSKKSRSASVDVNSPASLDSCDVDLRDATTPTTTRSTVTDTGTTHTTTTRSAVTDTGTTHTASNSSIITATDTTATDFRDLTPAETDELNKAFGVPITETPESTETPREEKEGSLGGLAWALGGAGLLVVGLASYVISSARHDLGQVAPETSV